MNWKPITASEPAQGVRALTRIDDGKGPRNEAVLRRKGNLWFFADWSMYVYYRPTHFDADSLAPLAAEEEREEQLKASAVAKLSAEERKVIGL